MALNLSELPLELGKKRPVLKPNSKGIKFAVDYLVWLK